MPLSWPYGVTRPVVGQMFHVKHWLWRCSCSGCRVVCCWAGLLGVPVGGGPPARRPRSELRSARRLEARPGPAAAHGHRSQALLCPPVPPAPSTPAVPVSLVCGTPCPDTAYRHRVRVRPRGAPPVLTAPCTLNSGRTIAHVDSASVHGYEVLNQSPYTSIGISIPYGDRNCVIPSNHRQNSDICGAKC